MQKLKIGFKKVFLYFWAIFCEIKGFTKTAVVWLTGLDTPHIQLLDVHLIIADQNLPSFGF